MKHVKIGTRIAAGFALILLLLTIVVTTSYINVSRISSEVNTLTRDKWVKKELANGISMKMDDVSVAVRNIVLLENAESRKKETALIAAAHESINQNLDKLTAIVLSDTGRKHLAAIRTHRDAYRAELDAFLGLERTGRQKEAIAQVLGTLAERKREYNRVVEEFSLFQEQEAERSGAECNRLSHVTNTIALTVGITALLITFIIAVYLSRSITNPLNACVRVAAGLAVGDTGATLDLTARDETGDLQRAMARMVEAIRQVTGDGKMLAAAAITGRLSVRADATKHQGDFRAIVQGFNETLDSVIVPVNEIRGIMEAMAGGKLDRRMTAEVQGDFAVLKAGLHNALNTLTQAIANVTQNARQVASAASQTSGAVGQISDGSQNQLHAIGQVATAIKQTTASIVEVARNTEEASHRAKDSVVIVNEGRTRMNEMVSIVNNIAGNSEKINKITEVIEKIANKTNLLSLNAAIEAARAGEHGRGFAVVAEEVGKLAANAAESTQEIVALVNRAVKDAAQAVITVNEVTAGMQKISEGAVQTEAMLQGISVALEEQSAAAQEINVNIASLNKVAESNATAAEEITATVVELARLADNTRKEAEQFRV